MTPADKREVLAILRRVLIAPDWWTEIDAIEKEIEPCPSTSSPPTGHSAGSAGTTRSGKGSATTEEEPCPTCHGESERTSRNPLELGGSPCPDCNPTPTSETSGVHTETPAHPAGTAIAAIRKAWNRLRDAREGYLRSARRCEDVRPIGEAVAALIALDVPAVVALYDRDVTRFMEARDSWQQRAETAEASRSLHLASAQLNRRDADDWKQRAEAAEARAEKAERERDDWKRKHDTLALVSKGCIATAEADRDAARKERDDARDKALEDAAVLADEYDGEGMKHDIDYQLGDATRTARDIAAAIRAMKAKA